MSSHLIIGLGGTGGKVIREFRKRIFEEFRTTEPGNGVFIDYVYMDSSIEDLNDRAKWKVLGKSVHLGEAQKVNINGISASMLDNINKYPGLKGFLNPNDIQMMQNKMGALISAGIGGQRRRLGRMLLANNMSDKHNPRNVEQVVRAAVGRLAAQSSDEDVTFHICAGLAGGTGSGSVVDIVSQLRTWYPYQESTKAFKIRLMLYLPENNMVNVKHDAGFSGFYQANGYAALSELNALSVGKLHPTDLRGEKDLLSGEIQRLLSNTEAFEAAYVYTNVNEFGKILDLGTTLPSAVADFLFQTIVVPEMLGTKGQMGRLVGCENDGAEPEMNQAGIPSRSRKFLGFGISRVEYPESEVREFVSYSYAHQASLQLTYNYWVDGQGFDQRSLEEVGSGYIDIIKNKKNRENLMLSNALLMLEKPIIESESTKKWKEIDITWENRLQREADEVQIDEDKKSWLGKFSNRCKVFYDEQYRNHGVKTFYNLQRKEIKGYAQFIRRHIEKQLFTEWQTGTDGGKSILEIEKFVSILIQDCGDRIAAFNKQKSTITDEQSDFAAQIKDINAEWNNIGWLKDAITSASTKVFAKYKTALCGYYASSTRLEAYDYAKELLQEIILQLEQVLEAVKAFKDRLATICNNVNELAGKKCKINEAQDDTEIKKYNPEKVHSIVRQYTSNRDYQTANAAAIRNQLVATLGEDGVRSFANLYDKVDESSMTDIILDICTTNACSAMEETAKNDPLNRMVGVNILDKLKQDLNSDEKLEQFVKSVVKSSGAYIQFNNTETAQQSSIGAMMSMVQLCLPEGNEQTEAFRKKLIDMFCKTVPGFNPTDDIAIHYNPSQLIVVSAYAGFPVRYLLNVKTLKEKYDKLLASPDGDFNKMVLHMESFKDELPALFEEKPQELRAKLIKPLMLAFTMNLMQEKENPSTGEHFIAMKGKDEFGDDTWLPVGKNFADILTTLSQDFAKATALMNQVKDELKVQARTNDQKEVLKRELSSTLKVQVMGSLCEGNEFHPDYPKYKALAVEILNTELKQL